MSRIDPALTGQYAAESGRSGVVRILNVISRSPDGKYLIAGSQAQLRETYYAVCRITEQTAHLQGGQTVTMCEQLDMQRNPEDFEDFLTYCETDWQMQRGTVYMVWRDADTWRPRRLRLVFDRTLCKGRNGSGGAPDAAEQE